MSQDVITEMTARGFVWMATDVYAALLSDSRYLVVSGPVANMGRHWSYSVYRDGGRIDFGHDYECHREILVVLADKDLLPPPRGQKQ